MTKVIAKTKSKRMRLTGVSMNSLRRKMEEVLKEHPHVCETCDSHACRGHYNLNNQIIIKGIKADRLYVFECLGYKAKDIRSKASSPYTTGELKDKYDVTVPLSMDLGVPDMTMGALVDEYVEGILAQQEFEEKYGDLLDQYNEPVIFCRSRH